MEKLVRDRIPEIIRATGRDPVVRVASDAEMDALLRAKLVEEVDEFLASGEPEELADVLEVVLALAERAGLDPEALEQLRAEKAGARGRFSRRIVWSNEQGR
ncbi:MAG TPA: nucleoside triphosphate pyrophosphohydrolase [Micromonosporaceae bacterium]|nr:nucleoside triphosphate pyrophosphohydrolase [Micromonosporaceae bacterium]